MDMSKRRQKKKKKSYVQLTKLQETTKKSFMLKIEKDQKNMKKGPILPTPIINLKHQVIQVPTPRKITTTK